MRLPRVRLTVEWVEVPLQLSVRRMMVVVAVLTMTLGALAIRARRDRYLDLMRNHDRSAQAATAMQDLLAKAAELDDRHSRDAPGRLAYEFSDDAILSRSMVGYWSRKATYHERLRRKYEAAASRPWLLVSPDPDPPVNPLRP